MTTSVHIIGEIDGRCYAASMEGDLMWLPLDLPDAIQENVVPSALHDLTIHVDGKGSFRFVPAMPLTSLRQFLAAWWRGASKDLR